MSAIDLAERSEWAALNALLLDEPHSAEEVDDYGMLPLHWACTDATVTLDVVETLLALHPAAARTPNAAGLLPLHIAVKAEIDVPIIELLLAAFPAALDARTPHGETPGDLGRKYESPPELCALLQIEYDYRRRLSVESSLSKSRSSSISSNLSFVSGTGIQGPPRWQHGTVCHVCQAKFGPFRSRHHCRGCGVSVCNAHSRGRMALPHLGLPTLQRVCAACYEEFNPEGPRVSASTLTSSRTSQRRLRAQTEDFLKSGAAASLMSPVLPQKTVRLHDPAADMSRPSRTSSESSHDIDLLQESIQTLNRTKALLQEQVAAQHRRSRAAPPADWPQTTPESVLDVAQTQHLLGVALADKGSHATAILELRKSLAMKTNPTVMYDLAKTLHASGDLDGAEAVLREALTLCPDNDASKQKMYTMLGKVLYAKGDSDAAIEIFQQALSFLSHGGDESSDDEAVGSATAEF
ncbi:Aste57867_12246 [Aphanomyces stellatus]|uniref:Aste57867_12246 protein n=1 Tax=Aphanomyces stellatus TaxID=120398 RepID=A0A485KX27_9STRA|nr:hypothetical protein As57867_012201 [Aphanomyces stellatus]VFT89100.1 Aste57867_12246 [Aphanomyces stellatus]